MKKDHLVGMVGVTAAALTTAVVVQRLRRYGYAVSGGTRRVQLCHLSEEHYLMPTPSIRNVLKPYRTRIPVKA